MDPDPIRVLLVEDNPGDARLIREMLVEIHTDRYEVVHVERLEYALLHLNNEKFDTILLDLNLPDAYGLSTLVKIRAKAPHVPVIVVSGLGDEEMAIHALREGAYTYLVKGQMSGHLLDRSIRYSIERERMEQIVQLQRAREYAENIVDTIRESLIVLDNRLRIVSANRSFYLDFHVTPEQVEGRFIHDLADQEWNIPQFLALLEKILHHSFQYEGLELDHEFPALGRRVMLLNARWVYEERGDTDRILLAMEDITERKRAEEALADEKERLAVTLWNIGEGVIVTDVGGSVGMMNRVAESLTGWTASEAVGLPIDQVYQVINEKTRNHCVNPVAAVLKKEETTDSSHFRLLIGKDGIERPLGDSVAAVRDKDGKIIGVVIVFRDITAARRMEEDLAKNERLESIGVLAGGIAHDFNNALTAIEGNIVVAKAHLKPEEKAYERLSEAEMAAHRARDLTRQLLTFSRGGKPIKRQLRLNDLLIDAVSFALSGSAVRKKFSIAEDLWPVEADEGQIRQVINNLVINADQAMPDGGILDVIGDNVSLASDQVLSLKAGNYVRIAVKDHGIGIPKEFLSKIYEPYFTTKQKGSGLGLTVAYSILRNHGGSLIVDSVTGGGSTFTLYIPASQMQLPVESVPSVHPLQGNERILWMDDETMIREVGGEMLSLLGYRFAFAEEGDQAIELYKAALESESPFDAVILDLTGAGGLGGKETIKQLLELDPQVRAIVCSGYSNDPVMANHREYGFRGVLTKPFTMKELDDQIHLVIGTEE
ncbi:hybrid sensor histidine kinase/response regulator [Methanosphaerula palustris]|uniref:PAS/PAC sensor hybrid histidine kinase n=1 Tax=Methanosphaerula palustris (strain ATCC BAA-1556 / DSM 19958 / E1-9c) TaxID=521011 RepID=B8GIL9_METPE|nr:hybrid sensor histidine kinase/response regulator [Methanosphaerula palustris]ACL16832.1 PAS/PAC sensor hybrid histidine kinase [Methanosphaerula palustris E1-9c]